ncbi:MAG TPA: hypothetical protein VI589_14765 [Vicinamibacteria bacterium]
MSFSALDLANEGPLPVRVPRRLDFTRPFLPESLAGAARLEFLTPVERLTLNHIRGNAYLSEIAFMEDLCCSFPSSGPSAEGDGPAWFRVQFEKGFGSPCEVIVRGSPPVPGAPAEAEGAVLAPLHLAWLAEIHDREARLEASRLDPGFRGFLRDRAARSLHEGARFDDRLDDLGARGGPFLAAQVVDAYAAYVEQVTAGLDRQVRNDLESLMRATSRELSPSERSLFLDVQTAATRRTFLGLVLGHPAFLRTVGRLGLAARARVEEMAWAP